MKTTNLKKFNLLLLLLFSISTAFTQSIPQKISYQGKLMESGVAVNGQKNFVFSFPNTSWTESHSNVLVTNGLYSVQLGSTNPIPDTVFTKNSSVTLQIVVEGVTLSPQTEILSVAYAFKSLKANNADSLAGKEANVYQNIESINNLHGDNNANLSIAGGENITISSENNTVTISAPESSNNEVNGNVIELISGESINGASTPIPVYIDKNGLILEQGSGNSNANIYGIYRNAQTFQTDAGTTEIKKVSLNLEKIATPSGNIEVSIYAVDGSNHPIGSAIALKSVSANNISNSWNDFQFDSPISVSASTTYVIVASLPDGDAGNYIIWNYNSSNIYSAGNYLSCDNFSNIWTDDSGKDFTFKLYSNSRVYACQANNENKRDFIGFALTNANEGESITIQTTGIVDGFSSLNTGEKYYLQNILGTIGITKGSVEKIVGVALNDGKLTIFQLTESPGVKIGTEYWSPQSSSDTKIITHNLGRIPKMIEIYYKPTNNGSYVTEIGGKGMYNGDTYATIFSCRSGNPGYSTSGTSTYIIYVDTETSSSNWGATISEVNTNSFTLLSNYFSSSENIYFSWKVY